MAHVTRNRCAARSRVTDVVCGPAIEPLVLSETTSTQTITLLTDSGAERPSSHTETTQKLWSAVDMTISQATRI